MSKRRTRNKLDDDAEFNEISGGSDLPDPDQVEQQLQKSQVGQKKEKYGRPPDPAKTDRVKFTTMLDPELRDQLKKRAIDQGISVADLLERLVKAYLRK